MNGFSKWLRQFSAKVGSSLRNFMSGRYGHDRLNMVILWTGVACCFLPLIFQNAVFTMLMSVLSYVLMFWAIFRCLSRNTYKRYQENRKFLQFFDRLKDRDHRYFDCPKCRQMVRVPRGKGKISITCPRCREKFVKKT